MTTEIKRRQGQRGSKPKDVCPKCEKEYLQTASIKKDKKWVRVGLCCPSETCDYIIKDLVEIEDTGEEEEGEEEDQMCTDKAEKIKKLTAEFVKRHEELGILAEQINELENE